MGDALPSRTDGGKGGKTEREKRVVRGGDERVCRREAKMGKKTKKEW